MSSCARVIHKFTSESPAIGPDSGDTLELSDVIPMTDTAMIAAAGATIVGSVPSDDGRGVIIDDIRGTVDRVTVTIILFYRCGFRTSRLLRGRSASCTAWTGGAADECTGTVGVTVFLSRPIHVCDRQTHTFRDIALAPKTRPE